MARPTEDQRKRRAAILQFIFDELDRQGRKRVWFADRLGISIKSLWNYEHGERRVPPDFIEQARKLLKIPREQIPPREALLDHIQVKPFVRRAASSSTTAQTALSLPKRRRRTGSRAPPRPDDTDTSAPAAISSPTDLRQLALLEVPHERPTRPYVSPTDSSHTPPRR